MIKKRISLMLVIAMLLSLMIPTVAFGAVNDYSGHWAEKTIQAWFNKDMLKGYEDGSFRPDTQITRAEFMTMVNNAFEFEEKAEISFSDVDSDDWFYKEVQKAVKAEYLIGYEDNTARPGNKITRQEAALIIARIKNLSNYAAGANRFADVAEIATWAKGGVGAVADEGYMIGYEDITFRPLRFISRAEALVTIDRAMDKAKETPPSTGGGSGGGRDDDKEPAPLVTPAAISYTINGVVYDTVTSSAITTTATAIKINVTTYGNEEVTIGHSTTSSAIVTPTAIEVTTSAAISGGVIYTAEVPLVEGDNFIYIKIGEEEYILHIIKEEEELPLYLTM